MIKEWLIWYTKEGYAGLTTRKRGRPKAVEPKTVAERIRQLEMENEVLRSFLDLLTKVPNTPFPWYN